jgi:glycosyltransferase involved in cell wall biosynthesis
MNWQYETFPKKIVRGEFCLSYRTVDNPYNLGHSLYKIGVFMAQGVPAIASPVPSYIEVLGTTNSGKICSSLNEWGATLDRIMEDRQTLKTWSTHARQVMETYSTDVVSHKYVDLFQRLCAS